MNLVVTTLLQLPSMYLKALQYNFSINNQITYIMKKLLFTVVLVWICSLANAQNVDDIFKEFKNEPNAECVNVSPFLMSIGKLFAHGEGSSIISKIKSMKVLDLERCTATTKERFNQSIEKLKLNKYETLIRVNDSGEKVRILAKQKKDYISELLIISIDKDDCTLVQINGKIRQKDIDKLIAQQTGNKNGRS